MRSPETPAPVHPFLLGVLRGSDAATLLPPASEADWEEIIRDAGAHGLIPLLHRRLKRSGAGRIPPGPADELERAALGIAARNMLLSEELVAILRAFEAGRLPCAPLRGPVLAEQLYGDIGARPMGDLDLLVRKQDLAEAAEILQSLGFLEMDRRAGFARAYSYTLKFFKDRHGWVIVEPHWTLAYPPYVDRLDMERIWERCVRGRVLGVETWMLGREELVLHLCLHLLHRGVTAPLLWLYEVDQLLRQEQATFDWSRFSSLAHPAKLEFLLGQALRRVRAVFGTPVPERVVGELSLAPSGSVEGRLVRLLAGRSSVDGKESLSVLLTLGGVRPRIAYALALLFPSAEFMRMHYGLSTGWQLGLGYLRRLCRLSWDGVRGIGHLARPDHPALGRRG